MNLPRFYCPQLAPGVVTLDKEQTRHALLSLRLRPGDRAELFNGAGEVAAAGLQPASDTGHADKPRRHDRPRATFSVEKVEQSPAPRQRLTLIVAACKGPRLTWMVEKCTELGVSRIVFTKFERSVVNLGEGHLEKLRRTAIEACKQCGRNRLPEIDTGRTLDDRVAAGIAGTVLVADPHESAVPLAAVISKHTHNTIEWTGFIGPEGGLAPDETSILYAQGGTRVRLADHVLRVETAAVSMAAVVAAFERTGR